MRAAALHFGTEYHLLDHIAPLAALLEMPLFVEELPEIAELYYPQAERIFSPDLHLHLGKLSERYDTLFRCGYWSPHLKQLFWDLYRKKMRFVFCPHGQSDKGFHSPLLTAYAEQEIALLYGPLMQEMLEQMGIWHKMQKSLFVGNYRLAFYQRHKAFYDALIEKSLFSKLDAKKPTLLYAPTWQDSEESSSFFVILPRLLEELPAHWNLLVKPHPLLESREPARYFALACLCEQKPNILLLERMPLVYPLLARSDVYLGDFSSIGYDYLAFERPMFFLDPTNKPLSDPARRLHRCGLSIDPARPYAFIEEHLAGMQSWRTAQRALYAKVYSDCPDLKTMLTTFF